MKKFLLSTIALLPMICNAAGFESPGNGTAYTLKSLSEIESSGITEVSPNVYLMTGDVLISAGDSFKMDNGATLRMSNTNTFRIEGTSDFVCTDSTSVTRNLETDLPKGVYLATESTNDVIRFKNVHFEYAGLRAWVVCAVELDNCSFRYNNGKNSSSGALSLAQSGSTYKVTNCDFIKNEVPAIGGSANMTTGILIEDCYFEDNNTANSNKPQLNLTVGGDDDVIIRNNTIKGAKRTKVGAIAVANLMGLTGSNNVVIEGNYMDNHRYAITTNGALNARIINNTMIDNKYETNAMNGGSGISIYDSSYNQDVYVEGNHIEGSLWGITIIGGKNVNVGKTDNPSASDYNPGKNVFVNNGNGGALYDLYNNGKNTVYAQGNTWNVDEQTAEKIETVITHKVDNSSLGLVVFMSNNNAIEGVEIDNDQPVEYFNLQGIKVTQPQKGIFVKKQGTKVTKVIL